MIVKVCGITSGEQAKMVVRAGADWVGLNLVGGSRRIDLETAERIVGAMDDPDRAVVLWELGAQGGAEAFARLRAGGVRRLQVYGVKEAVVLAEISAQGFETILVRHVRDESSIAECIAFLERCGEVRPNCVLLDAAAEGQLGGTGKRLNWEMLTRYREEGWFAGWPAIILAGGLRPENVREAIERVRPAGVDVSSGVERAPGLKDEAKVSAFVQAVRGFKSTSLA